MDPYTERKNTENRSSQEANINDISDALQKLDEQDNVPSFAARSIDKLPDRQPEEVNLISLLNRITKLENKFNDYEEVLSNHEIDLHTFKSLDIETKIKNIDEKINFFREDHPKILNGGLRYSDKEKDMLNDNESEWESLSGQESLPSIREGRNIKRRKMKYNVKKFNKKQKLSKFKNAKMNKDEADKDELSNIDDASTHLLPIDCTLSHSLMTRDIRR